MTPIERAARAAANAEIGADEWDDMREESYDICRAKYRDIARAVIEAIREPSDAMTRAAILSTIEISDDDRNAEREFRTEFAAAIDAALGEGS